MAKKAQVLIEVDSNQGVRQLQKFVQAQEQVSAATKKASTQMFSMSGFTKDLVSSFTGMFSAQAAIQGITMALNELNRSLEKSKQLQSTAVNDTLGLTAMGVSRSRIDEFRKMAAGHGQDTAAAATLASQAIAAHPGSTQNQNAFVEAGLVLGEFGIDAETSSGALFAANARGMSAGKAADLIMRTSSRVNMDPKILTRAMNRSDMNPHDVMAISAGLKAGGADPRRIPSQVGIIQEIMSGQRKINSLSTEEQIAWNQFERGRSAFDEVSNYKPWEGGAADLLDRVMRSDDAFRGENFNQQTAAIQQFHSSSGPAARRNIYLEAVRRKQAQGLTNSGFDWMVDPETGKPNTLGHWAAPFLDPTNAVMPGKYFAEWLPGQVTDRVNLWAEDKFWQAHVAIRAKLGMEPAPYHSFGFGRNSLINDWKTPDTPIPPPPLRQKP